MLITELMLKETNVDKMKRWVNVLEEYFSKLSEEDYCNLYDEIYEISYGEVLSKEKANYLVGNMKPYGEKWDMEDTAKLLTTSDYLISTRYYVLNMMYNDYHEMFGEDSSKYVAIAKLWLNDKDSVDGDTKAYRYSKIEKG